MSVTVADCLKLPALREAVVAAGEKGLDRIVTAVSVLEYVDFAVLAHDFFIGNELIITAFVCVKDDVESQCKTIERLSEAGEVGLILYYVGIFVPSLDQRLLDTANRLNFPIIRMPLDRLDFRYSDVISEVLDAIIKDRMHETYFVNTMLERISQLNEQQRSITTVMRMLSDQLRCTLLLCGDAFQRLGFATWPMSSSLTFESVLKTFKESAYSRHAQGDYFNAEIGGVKTRIYHAFFDEAQYKNLGLIAVDEKGSLGSDDLKQAVELLQFFISIWKYDFHCEGIDSLIPAILNDNPDKMYRIAKSLSIDVASIHTMWIIRAEKKGLSPADRRIYNERTMVKAKFFLKDHGKSLLVDIHEDNVIIFLGDASHEELDEGIAANFAETVATMDMPFSFTVCSGLQTTAQTRTAYVLFCHCIDKALQIYPSKRPLTAFHLQFAMDCQKIFEESEEVVAQYLEVLQPLSQLDDGRELIDTLAVYLLDADISMQATGDLMFLHKNTVKYRLNKIKQCLNYDITKMPESYQLYRAAALERLLRQA